MLHLSNNFKLSSAIIYYCIDFYCLFDGFKRFRFRENDKINKQLINIYKTRVEKTVRVLKSDIIKKRKEEQDEKQMKRDMDNVV